MEMLLPFVIWLGKKIFDKVSNFYSRSSVMSEPDFITLTEKGYQKKSTISEDEVTRLDLETIVREFGEKRNLDRVKMFDLMLKVAEIFVDPSKYYKEKEK